MPIAVNPLSRLSQDLLKERSESLVVEGAAYKTFDLSASQTMAERRFRRMNSPGLDEPVDGGWMAPSERGGLRDAERLLSGINARE
jgi:hypothetical protein